MILAKSVKYILKFSTLTITIFISVAYIFSLFPSTQINQTAKKSEEIFILYDEMHTDIILNTKYLNRKLTHYLSPLVRKREGYLAFGWGDKESYLNTPTWDKIRLSTTLKALFINSSSLIHVHFYKEVKQFKNLKKLLISHPQINLLVENILKSFDQKKVEKEQQQGYGFEDYFYPSIHSYNLFNTCNTWSGKQLREINISVSYWTPFSWNIINSLPENE